MLIFLLAHGGLENWFQQHWGHFLAAWRGWMLSVASWRPTAVLRGRGHRPGNGVGKQEDGARPLGVREAIVT